MTEPVETADPRHYFRLILSRLLETQQVLSCYKNSPPEVRAQQYFNASTLSEVKSWLEATGGDWEITRSSSIPSKLAISGPNLSTAGTPTRGSPWAILQKGTPIAETPDESPAPSSPPSRPGTIISRSSNGRITFLPNSGSEKPGCT